jgi:hypothetical protein
MEGALTLHVARADDRPVRRDARATVCAEEDPRDAERQFRFLLSRGDELRAQKDQFDPQTPPAGHQRWKAQLKHLERDYQHFLHDHPRPRARDGRVRRSALR